MSKDTVSNCEKPETFIDDPLTDILRKGARKLLAEALDVEIEIFLSHYADLKDSCGRQRIVPVTDTFLNVKFRPVLAR